MHLFIDILRNSILITGLVVVMMMMIESLNIESKGMVFKGLRKTKTGQVIIASLLGSIPGCMGGFATVSLYTHRMFSFGALVAMMIASSGDEAFVMLAMIPDQALVLFAVLFVLAIVVGVAADKIYDLYHARKCHKHEHHECGVHADCEGYEIHEDCHDGEVSAHAVNERHNGGHEGRHYGWKRITMFVGLAIFIAALAAGQLGHDHSAHSHSAETHMHEHHHHEHGEDCECGCHDHEHHHHHHDHGHHHHHVSRPHCPPPRPYHRPVPPPSFRAYHGCPVLRSIVGITFGTAINLSLDYLNRNGYTVHGYGNDVVYLRNISQYGYNWPDATLYYSSHGLVGSEFVYSTSYNSRSRYNSVYNTLYNQYGAPISVDSSANGVTVTWWGYDNQYVSLDYHPIYTNNGQLRYVTTLSMGM